MTELSRLIDSFFRQNKIEYYSAVDYSCLKEINPALRERSGITPRSAIVFLIPYFVSKPKNLSAYAVSRDYHLYVKELTRELANALKNSFPEYNFLGYGDHSPIDERHAALISGLGILGDSQMLINEKYGTYTFIAEIITDMPKEKVGIQQPKEIKTCNHCGACRRACPGGKLNFCDGECLSEITQKKGELSENEIKMMRKIDTVWGCDVCQEVCPHNKTALKTPIEFFYENRVELLTEEYIDSLTKEELMERAFGWRGKGTILRNVKLLGCSKKDNAQ